MIYKHFISKANSMAKEYEGKGRLFIYSMDYVNFTLIGQYYGKERAKQLISNTLDFFESIPTCIYCENTHTDHIMALILLGNNIEAEEIIKRFEFVKASFLTRKENEMPAYVIRMWCGICEVAEKTIEEAAVLAEAARRDAKAMSSEIPVIYTDEKEAIARNYREAEIEMVKALHNKEFTYYLQPKVDLTSGKIVGAEALARRIKPDGTIGMPDTFIELFEKNRLIVDLDCLILEKVCGEISRREKEGKPVLPISVNLSVHHINNPRAPMGLDRIVKKYIVPSYLINYELTENVYMQDFKKAMNIGNEFKRRGYERAIDDFGSGYSGINLWRYLEFEELKLDMSFMREEPKLDGKNHKIIAGIARTTELLGVRLVAEGIENLTQCERLLEIGCRYGQGFFFSKPLPAEEFYAMYERQNGKFELTALG